VLGHPAGVGERPAQEHLDVGVEAAELVAGPAHQRVMDRGIDTEQYLAAISHV
jgi:hypothetical protein